jgi:predicted transcriptional regulator
MAAARRFTLSLRHATSASSTAKGNRQVMDDQASPAPKTQLMEMTTGIVSSFVSNNKMTIAELPAFIAQVHAALTATANGKTEAEPEKREPAVSIKSSVKPDYIVCLEDGKKFKSLKRHLRTAYNMTPEEYRKKWGLNYDYPMVAPAYAAKRSELAKSMGLGSMRAKAAKAEKSAAKPAATRKARRKKAAA